MQAIIPAAAAALSGIRLGLVPIGLVVIAALFTYRLCEQSGAMTTIRSALKSVSDDKVIVTLLVAWGFGNFMEGMAGFGTAVAIPAAILFGFGLDPVKAIVTCLIANTVATGFGAVGVSIIVLSQTANVDLAQLSAVAAWPIAAIGMCLPVLLVAYQIGWRNAMRYLPICLVAGLSFAMPVILIARTMGPELPVIVSGLVTMLAIVLFKPRSTNSLSVERIPFRTLLLAAAPFVSVVVLLAVYALAIPKAIKNSITPGAVILVAAVIGGLVQRLSVRTILGVLWASLIKAKRALITICTILAIAKVLEQLGAIAFVADLVVTLFGRGYAFAATLVGVSGGALTGSGTNTCVLFGGLQHDAAVRLSINPILFASANILGAGIGKMICPQSIAIGLATVGLVGAEGKIVKGVLPWFVGVALGASFIVGLVITFFPSSGAG